MYRREMGKNAVVFETLLYLYKFLFFFYIYFSFFLAIFSECVHMHCVRRWGSEKCACVAASMVCLVRGMSVSGGIVDRTGHTAPRRVLRSSWNNAEARGSERSTPLCGSWNGTNAFRANLRANRQAFIFGLAQGSLFLSPLMLQAAILSRNF